MAGGAAGFVFRADIDHEIIQCIFQESAQVKAFRRLC
jgi:hypothetical protein